MPPNLQTRYSVIASYLLIALFLLLVLKNGLLGALFAGLLIGEVFSCYHSRMDYVDRKDALAVALEKLRGV